MIVNNICTLGIGEMTSNSKNESLSGSKKPGGADETIYPEPAEKKSPCLGDKACKLSYYLPVI